MTGTVVARNGGIPAAGRCSRWSDVLCKCVGAVQVSTRAVAEGPGIYAVPQDAVPAAD